MQATLPGLTIDQFGLFIVDTFRQSYIPSDATLTGIFTIRCQLRRNEPIIQVIDLERIGARGVKYVPPLQRVFGGFKYPRGSRQPLSSFLTQLLTHVIEHHAMGLTIECLASTRLTLFVTIERADGEVLIGVRLQRVTTVVVTFPCNETFVFGYVARIVTESGDVTPGCVGSENSSDEFFVSNLRG